MQEHDVCRQDLREINVRLSRIEFVVAGAHRGTSLIKKSALLGPYIKTMNEALWWVLVGAVLSYDPGTPVRCTVYGKGCRV